MLSIMSLRILIGLTALGSAPSSHAASVATSSPEATQIASTVLKSGGNAVDAACAAVFALNVTQSDLTGVGGGGFALVQPSDGAPSFLEFREQAPASTTDQQFYNKNGKYPGKYIEDWFSQNTGPKSVGIPGVVAGCGDLVKKYGHIGWKKIIAPSVELARSGFKVSEHFQEELSDQWKRMEAFPASQLAFQNSKGDPVKKEEILKQPLLAQTLDKLAQEGAEGFYIGHLAHEWLAEAKELGVRITAHDLSSYRSQNRPTVSFDFGNFHGVTISPPSGASVTVAGVLRYLAHFFETHSTAHPFSTGRYVATIESKAYFEHLRNTSFSDPSRMIFKPSEFAGSSLEKEAWREIDATVEKRLKKEKVTPELSGHDREVSFSRLQSHTAHISVVDDSGMAVALTSSVGNIFGSGIVLPHAGFVLNSTLGDFHGEAGHLNSPAPGMRPLSNMSPVLVYERFGSKKLLGALGAAGGPLIPSGVVDFAVNYFFCGLVGDDSIRSPRVHTEDGVHVLVEKKTPSAVVDELKEMGYQVEITEPIWAVFEGVVRHEPSDSWEAVADPRYDGLGI